MPYALCPMPARAPHVTEKGYICLSAIVIWQHYNLRRLGAEISDCPTKYWWLGGLGGALVAAIAIGSAIKTESGWGWTWRGRPLQIKS
jgi:hypothetical protein